MQELKEGKMHTKGIKTHLVLQTICRQAAYVTSQKNQNFREYISSNSGGGGTWGSISGTLSAQTDLQNALNAKAATSQLQNGNIVIFLKNIPNCLIFLISLRFFAIFSAPFEYYMLGIGTK